MGMAANEKVTFLPRLRGEAVFGLVPFILRNEGHTGRVLKKNTAIWEWSLVHKTLAVAYSLWLSLAHELQLSESTGCGR